MSDDGAVASVQEVDDGCLCQFLVGFDTTQVEEPPFKSLVQRHEARGSQSGTSKMMTYMYTVKSIAAIISAWPCLNSERFHFSRIHGFTTDGVEDLVKSI